MKTSLPPMKAHVSSSQSPFLGFHRTSVQNVTVKEGLAEIPKQLVKGHCTLWHGYLIVKRYLNYETRKFSQLLFYPTRENKSWKRHLPSQATIKDKRTGTNSQASVPRPHPLTMSSPCNKTEL